MHDSSKHPSLKCVTRGYRATLGFTSTLRRACANCSEALFLFRRQQAHRRNARGVHYIDHFGHHREFHRRVAPNKRRAVNTHPKNFVQPAAERFPSHRLPIDAQGPVRQHLNNDHFIGQGLFPRRRRLLGNLRIKADVVRRDDHKNHQEHEKDIDQRNNVGIRDDTTLTAKYYSHESPRRGANAPRGGLSQPARNLLTSFELGGNQANLVDAGPAHDVDGAGDVQEQYIVVAFDESNFLGALLEDLFHAGPQTFPGGVFIIDLELSVVGDLDDDSLVFQFDVLLLVGRGLRDERIQALGRERRDDHENDDQHKQNVDQRHDIRGRHRPMAGFSNFHPHCESPVGLGQSASAGHETAPGRIRRGSYSGDRKAVNQISISKRMAQTTLLLETRSNAGQQALRSSIRGRRRRSCLSFLVPLGEQTELIDTGGANLVDDGDNIAILGARIALDINGLVQPAGKTILDLARQIFLQHLRVAQVYLAVTSNGYDNGVILVGVLHVAWIVRRSQVDLVSLLQHGGDHHEDDQQDEHDVGHGNNVGGRHLWSDLWLVGHGVSLLGAAAQDEVVDELHRGVVHLDVEGFHFVGEIVVGPDGWDGHEETEGGSDERFRDTAGDGRQTSGLVCLDALKGVQNADDRAKEPDERRRRADGSKSREAPLHLRVHDGDGALETALGGVDHIGVRYLLRSRLEFGEPGGNDLGNVALLVALGDGDGFVQTAVLEGARDLLNEDAGLLACRAVHQRTVNHYAERVDGKNEQDEDHDLRNEGHISPHGAKIPLAATLQECGCINIQSCYHSFAP